MQDPPRPSRSSSTEIIQRAILRHLRAAGARVGRAGLVSGATVLVACSGGSAPATQNGDPQASTQAPEGSAPNPAPEPPPATGPGECRTDEDCGPDRFCQLSFNGAEFLDEPGQCVDEEPIYEGRPLIAAGVPALAPLELRKSPHPDERMHDAHAERGQLDATMLGWLRRAAREEHASIAAFARTICELMALGAPLELVQRTQSALADEIRHATQCAAWLGDAADTEVAWGPLPEAVMDFARDATRAERLLEDIVRGGVIGESLAAALMQERAGDPAWGTLREGLAIIADDEARHAALAIDSARWLLSIRPDLVSLVDRERARFEREASAEARHLLRPLWSLLTDG